ncbi:unnamed protein product [Schistosoma margrebowiei]|uniref:Uncharacterized protein n=1 Tax=Schistosoma margrebowiei TaxID=48269 RepID=A0A183N8X5_9TREM|nr:unnamed protein product [Schistosoma margrebowiei]
MFAVTSVSDYGASAGILSGRAAFPPLICLVAILISSTFGAVISIERSIGAASMSDGFNGASAFVSPLIQMFGFRISGCFGALLLGLGMSIASYLTNMHAITIFYGMISG